ncbi:MAG TPA: FHA domain-containing protein [Nocardioides sp.]|nr:FHA domain-containing protein [Nocardioides sp.]
MPFCTNCGRQNPDDARFCSQCGTRLVGPDSPASPPTDVTATIQFGGSDKVETSDRQLSAVDAAAVDALPRGHALLVVQKGPGAGSRFLLDQNEVTAGRHPQSAIFLDDVTVSRSHAIFRRTPAGYTVEDAGSLNGTYVNRNRIEKVDLHDGDEVQVGKYRLVYFSGHNDA